MKKFVIACAIILAGVLSSCGDTNYCYEVTATINVLGYDDSMGHAMSATGYQEIITDNKFLLFDRMTNSLLGY